MSTIVSPSLLAADFANLQQDVELVNESAAEWVHIDIMDGVFVPNISFGIPVCHAINRHAKVIQDVHLMIENPGRYVEDFRKAGADYITVHYEACRHLHRDIQLIHSTGAKAGVALNPHTPVEVLTEVIADLDLVLLMSVNPGFGGQKLIPGIYDKVKRLKALIEKSGSKALIEVDGGVNAESAPKLVEAGVDALVAGSYVFGSDDPKETIASLSQL
ncbi:ribulose-phosphate 3-epimerase [Persicobacter psychrovividus]|uniref:Ribulose-phosphate 3-epimerase n=1 Tax=Persicobacter psychrovividus TaxID=387638 RepID=A0ABM7VEI4_9BACT|nr:ribulose-phosphate 3-epimerase [Persicobacter psychrovividus]